MDGHTHYVIVVHGTFAAPVAGEPQWFELDEGNPLNFCQLLNDRFESAGLGRPIERSLMGKAIRFSWSGANDHAERIAAAERLYRLITTLMAEDRSARVHLIAHSHGGNIVLKALELYHTDIVNAACGWYWSLGLQMEKARELQLDDAMARHHTRGEPWPLAYETLLQDDEINQIGQVVFLGTPFYGKNWRTARWNAFGILLRLVRNALSAAVLLYAGLVLAYGAVLLARGMDRMRTLVTGGAQSPTGLPNLNVGAWSTTSLAACSLACLVLGAVAVRSEMRRRRRNIPNVYFDETTFAELLMDSSERRPKTPPFNALVVSMDLLDEALLGLSTEPIVYGLLAPRIRALFEPRQSITRNAIGVDHGDLSGLLADAATGLVRKCWQLTAPLRRALSWATQWLQRPVTNLLVAGVESFVLRLISSAAFGVPPQEFSDSSIVVNTHVGVPAYFSEVGHDVAPLWQAAALGGSVRSAMPDPSDFWRYAFLSDDRLLDALAARSSLCSELGNAERQLAVRYRDYPDDGEGLLRRLRRISVTLEHRLGDLVTGFGHVRYYSMPKVIDLIAQFIATGQAIHPSGADPGATTRPD